MWQQKNNDGDIVARSETTGGRSWAIITAHHRRSYDYACRFTNPRPEQGGCFSGTVTKRYRCLPSDPDHSASRGRSEASVRKVSDTDLQHGRPYGALVRDAYDTHTDDRFIKAHTAKVWLPWRQQGFYNSTNYA